MFLPAFLVSVALLWLWLVDNYIPEVPTEGEPGPRALPFLLGVILALLGIALAVQRDAKRPSVQHEGEWQVAVATFLLLLVYAFALDKIGFISSTTLLMMASMSAILAMRRWLFMVVFSIAFAAGTWLVFNTVLGIPLPRDPWLQ